MDDCNPVKTSLSPRINLSSLISMPFEQSKMKLVSYLLTVGFL